MKTITENNRLEQTAATQLGTRTRSPKKIKEQAAQLSAAAKAIVIEQPKTYSVCLEITGTSDLIQNNFSQKSVEAMLRKHMGHTVQREKKVPRQLLEEATCRNMDGKIAMSPICFKKAMLSASTETKQFKKTQLRTALFIQGNSIPITFEKNVPRMDICRLQGIGRVPDIRFRPSFQGWKARLILEFSDSISVQSIVDLLNRAGRCGVGEWRPTRDGIYGAFKVTRHISDPKEIGQVEAECAVALRAISIPDWALDMEISPELADSILNSTTPGELSEAAPDSQ